MLNERLKFYWNYLFSGVGPHDLTLTAKRKISQRHQKRSSPSHTCQQATQTEGVVMRRTSSLRVLTSSASSSNNTHNHRDVPIIDGEYYEEQAALYERLLKAEEVSYLDYDQIKYAYAVTVVIVG